MDQSMMIKVAANIWLLGLSLLMFFSFKKVQRFVGFFGIFLLSINIGTYAINYLKGWYMDKDLIIEQLMDKVVALEKAVGDLSVRVRNLEKTNDSCCVGGGCSSSIVNVEDDNCPKCGLNFSDLEGMTCSNKGCPKK